LAKIDLKNWQIKFIGEVEETFQPKIDAFFAQRPDCKNKVHFMGEIVDRRQLFEYYAQSKIICMPSKRESFGFAILEAMSMGNYLVGSDAISSINQLTDNGRFGHIVPSDNVKAMKKALQEVMEDDFYNKEMARDIIEYAGQYSWQNILPDLDAAIKQKVKTQAGSK